jgi:hypothetical protein
MGGEAMMYIVPPMDDEPPRDFVDFVAVHLADAQREAAQLVGDPDHADEVYPAAFSDVAVRWRRLRLQRRLNQRLGRTAGDVAATVLYRRLAQRAKQWRDEQIYDVDVEVLRPAPAAYAPASASIALRKAAVLPETARWQARPLAEAAIAWDHAWRQAQWRRIGRTVATVILILIALVQILPTAPD